MTHSRFKLRWQPAALLALLLTFTGITQASLPGPLVEGSWLKGNKALPELLLLDIQETQPHVDFLAGVPRLEPSRLISKSLTLRKGGRDAHAVPVDDRS